MARATGRGEGWCKAFPDLGVGWLRQATRRRGLTRGNPTAAFSTEEEAHGGGPGGPPGQGEEAHVPQEVVWTAEGANSVSLIGNLGGDPDLRYLESGQVVSRMSLAVSRGQNTDWFNCECWDQVAHLAAQHLSKGSRVQVQGKVVVDSWQDRQSGQRRTAFKVRVNQFDFVRSMQGAEGAAPDGGFRGGEAGGFSSQPTSGQPYGGSTMSRSTEARWAEFFAQPSLYWDNRTTKRNPRAPDFKHKDSGEALWIDSRDTPGWVADSLRKLDEVGGGAEFTPGGAADAGPGGFPPPGGAARNDEDIPF